MGFNKSDPESHVGGEDERRHCLPESSHDGAAVGLEGIAQEVSEGKRAQAVDRLILASFENNAVGQALVSGDGRFLRVNRALATMLGYTPDDLVNKRVNETMHAEDITQDRVAQEPLSLSRDTGRLQKRYIAPDGSAVWIEIVMSGICDESGHPEYFVGTFLDITDRKRAETALLESEARHRALFENSRDAMTVIAPPDWKFVAANAAALELFGVDSLEQLQLLGPLGVSPEYQPNGKAQAQTAKEMIAVALDEGCHFFEWQHQTFNGREIPTEISLTRVEIGGKDVILGTLRDRSIHNQLASALHENDANFTARTLVEEELRKQRQYLSFALDSARMGVWHVNFVTGERRFDEQVLRVLGIDSKAFRGTIEEFLNAVHPEDVEKVNRTMASCIEQGTPYEVEYRVVWPGGSIHDICARGRIERDSQGTAVRVDGILWDETEKVRAKQALQESEERFRLLAEAFPETIFESDTAGKLTYLNQHGQNLFGDAVAGRGLGPNLLDYVHPDDRARVLGRFRARMGGKPGEFLEYRALRQNGEQFIALAFSSPMHHGNELVGLRGFALDITTRKRAEMELIEANARLEAATVRANEMAHQASMANLAKSEFLTNMSHEIRTPMNGVIGMIGLLLDTELKPDQRRYAESVRTSGAWLLTLLNDILDLSKIEAGKLELEVLDFDLRALLDDFIGTVALRASVKNIATVCSVAPDVPALLRGDPGRLRRVLLNLAGNALKFTIRGQIAFRICVQQRTSEVVVLRLSVRDTGIGIPEDRLVKIFGKFEQVDASTTRKYGGSGLGLAISKQLTELMGGEIGVESVAGQGSEFWFTVRFTLQPASGDAESELQPPIAGTRVLVLESNDDDRVALVTQLAKWKLRVTAARDEGMALSLLMEAHASGDSYKALVTSSVSVSPMDTAPQLGSTAVSHPDGLRQIVLVSPGQQDGARARIRDGLDVCLVKPLRESELFAGVVRALGSTESLPSSPAERRDLARQVSRNNLRVLVAEDNITNQQVALGILRKLGVNAKVVANGREALDALRSMPYDLVLMDVQMPEVDGLEATRTWRASPESVTNRRIPIVAMTAHAMSGDRVRCLEAGMDDYITKPVTPNALWDMLEKWIPQVD